MPVIKCEICERTFNHVRNYNRHSCLTGNKLPIYSPMVFSEQSLGMGYALVPLSQKDGTLYSPEFVRLFDPSVSEKDFRNNPHKKRINRRANPEHKIKQGNVYALGFEHMRSAYPHIFMRPDPVVRERIAMFRGLSGQLANAPAFENRLSREILPEISRIFDSGLPGNTLDVAWSEVESDVVIENILLERECLYAFRCSRNNMVAVSGATSRNFIQRLKERTLNLEEVENLFFIATFQPTFVEPFDGWQETSLFYFEGLNHRLMESTYNLPKDLSRHSVSNVDFVASAKSVQGSNPAFADIFFLSEEQLEHAKKILIRRLNPRV